MPERRRCLLAYRVMDEDLTAVHGTVNIRNLSVKCGHCGTYQTLCRFERREDWNVYVYECENGECDPAMTRTLVVVPAAIDDFARRDPEWRGGRRFGGEE
jgi:hypothetical protein